MDLVPCTDSDVVLPYHDIEIIANLDIIELCTLNYYHPHYIPLSHTGKLEISNTLRLNVRVSLGTNNLDGHMNMPFNYYILSRTYCILGDDNCLFSSLAYLVTGCSDNCHQVTNHSIVSSIFSNQCYDVTIH